MPSVLGTLKRLLFAEGSMSGNQSNSRVTLTSEHDILLSKHKHNLPSLYFWEILRTGSSKNILFWYIMSLCSAKYSFIIGIQNTTEMLMWVLDLEHVIHIFETTLGKWWHLNIKKFVCNQIIPPILYKMRNNPYR